MTKLEGSCTKPGADEKCKLKGRRYIGEIDVHGMTVLKFILKI
jgi:hypothetical protein